MQTTGIEKLLLDVVKVLNKLKIKYFITGGYAVSLWGEIRSTIDIDIVVELIEPQVKPLIRELRKNFQNCYVDEEVATEATKQKSEFNFINPHVGLKIDFWVAKDDKKAKLEYQHRIAKTVNNQKVYFISPEDLILNKLIWARETQSDYHLRDVELVFKNSKVDLRYIKKQAEDYKILGLLKKILNKP
ncbi:MAG: DUF6036 family nucleotidyltransferase [Patescibacteria group bacterium]